MANLVKTAAVAFLLCFILIGTLATASPSSRSRRSYPYSSDDGLFPVDNGQESYTNGELVDTLMAQPSKRHWCRKGMTYNHVLGACTFSFAALRGRARRH